MKKEKREKKLILSRETIKALNDAELTKVAGGGSLEWWTSCTCPEH